MTSLVALVGDLLRALDEQTISVAHALDLIHGARPGARVQVLFDAEDVTRVRAAFVDGFPRTEMLLRMLTGADDDAPDVVVLRPIVDPLTLRYVAVESVSPPVEGRVRAVPPAP